MTRPITTLKRREDFLRLRNGKIAKRPAFVLQAAQIGEDGADGQIRVGFTCSKKVGNAVARNRAKRRLREVARLVLPQHAKLGWDYVFIGRAEVTAKRDFLRMQKEAEMALSEIHGDSK